MASFFQNIVLKRCVEDEGPGQEDLKGGEVLANIPFVALYFSAHWCPPCQRFTPILKDFYEEVNPESGSKQLEVIFVSSDRSPEQWSNYIKEAHGSWLTIPYENSDLRSELKRKYSVCAQSEMEQVGVENRSDGIPCLVLIKPDGESITITGCEDVETKGPAALNTWK